MSMHILKDWKPYLVITVIVFLIIAFSSPNLDKRLDGKNTDILEYQMVAVNLFKYHQFPVIGFLGDTANYKINTNLNWGISNTIRFREIVNNKPLIDMGKPPLYSLIVSALYQLTGYHVSSIRLLNIFIISFISVFQVYVGYRLLGIPGILIGIFAGCFYYASDYTRMYDLYPNYVVDFFLFVLYLLAITPRTISSVKFDFLTGFLMACMVLTNGNVMFVPIIYFAWTGFRLFFKPDRKRFLIQLGSFVAPIMVWIIFANIAFYNAKNERAAYVAKVTSEMVPITVDEQPFLNAPHYTNTDTLAWTYITKKMMCYCLDDGFIILSKQSFGDALLGAHNEFCEDGQWHLEWQVIRNSYYLTHPSHASNFQRVLSFYIDNPLAFVKNMTGKFRSSYYALSGFYYLSVLMLGLLSITSYGRYSFKLAVSILAISAYFLLPFQYEMVLFFFMFIVYNLGFFLRPWTNQVPWMIPFILNNATLITVITIGEPRFLQCLDPIIITGFFYLVVQLIKQLIPHGSK